MRLVWTYSKDWKKGENISLYTHEYIQFLFKQSILSAPNSYHKIICTEEENVNIFKDIVDEVIILPKRPFVFLADLKFYVADILNGEFLITDGDIIFNRAVPIPKNIDLAFEVMINNVGPLVNSWKNILLENKIQKKISLWNIPNESAVNLGLMYFNNDVIKNKLTDQYKKTQNFYTEYIEPKYKFNKKDKQFSACGAQMLVKQFLLKEKINPFYFNKDNQNNCNYTHYSSTTKNQLMKEYRALI